MIDLFNLWVTFSNSKPVHVVEVGTNNPSCSDLQKFLSTWHYHHATMIEPLSKWTNYMRTVYPEAHNLKIYNVAVVEHVAFNGLAKMYDQDRSTFLSGVPLCPALKGGYLPNENDSFEVQAATFNQLDDGFIDVLSVDVNGAEWYVLKNMVSRPVMISIAMHDYQNLYMSPFTNEILKWMEENKYILAASTNDKHLYLRSHLQ